MWIKYYLHSVLFYFIFVLLHDLISVYMYNKKAKRRIYFKRLSVFHVWKTYSIVQKHFLILVGFIPVFNLVFIGALISGLLEDYRARKSPH